VIVIVSLDRDPVFYRKTVPTTLLSGFRSWSRLTITITIDGEMVKLFSRRY